MSDLIIGRLQLDFGDWGHAGRIAESLTPVTWACTREKYPLSVTIPAGYMSDGASVPRWLWWFLPPWGDRATFAALIHDYLLDRLQGFIPGGPVPGTDTREDCDRQFLFALLALDIHPLRAHAVWLGVRLHSIRLSITGGADRPLVTS